MLFHYGDFVSSAGDTLHWKTECDALTTEDWETIAALIGSKLQFGSVEGVPTGGNALAKQLEIYVDEQSSILLIVDDVLTTGASMDRHRAGRGAIGVVLFCRGLCPGWIYPIWQLGAWVKQPGKGYI